MAWAQMDLSQTDPNIRSVDPEKNACLAAFQNPDGNRTQKPSLQVTVQKLSGSVEFSIAKKQQICNLEKCYDFFQATSHN